MQIDRTHRRNGKWAKLTGQRGKWTIALGWNGNVHAHKVQHTATRAHAEIIARNYLSE